MQRQLKKLTTLAVLLISATTMAGCGTNAPASVKGECKVFTAPGRVVVGKERVDQRWIDKTVEIGVTVCGWERDK